jgi:hypothetical protein
MLHGGPKHGERLALPEEHGNVLSFETLVMLQGMPARRLGQYTRVTKAGRKTHDFEWSGYTGPAEPLDSEE